MDYDEISGHFVATMLARDDRTLIHIPTARHYLGVIEGKSVLDFGCGEGFYTRLFSEWGASRVVGIDISKSMIDLALLKECQLKQGVRYFVKDIAKDQFEEDFDIVFSAFALHYAPSIADLRAMTQGISRVLKPRGRWVAFLENPFVPLHKGRRYEVEITAVDESGEPLPDLPAEGGRVRRTLFDKEGNVTCEFVHHHYKPRTYESAFRDAGFSSIAWKPFIMTDQVRADLEYWADYFKDYTISVFTGVRG